MDARDNIPYFNPALGFLFLGLGRGAAYTLGGKFGSLLGGDVALMDIPVSHISSHNQLHNVHLIANAAGLQWRQPL